MKFSITSTMRIAIGLTGATVVVLLSAEYLGLVPDGEKVVLNGRCALAESVAVPCCMAAQHNDVPAMRTMLTALVARNPEVASAAVRRDGGDVVVEAGEHTAHWISIDKKPPAGSQIVVPIYQRKQFWGSVEIRFRPLPSAASLLPWLAHPALRLTLFISGATFLTQLLYLKRVLRYLNPSSVVPDRVRATLDTLAEGVVILDNDQQIVLANKAFAESVGHKPDDLLGMKPSEMGWAAPDAGESQSYPWAEALQQGIARTNVLLRTTNQPEDPRTVSVSAVPILGAKGERRGALATFDDVTTVEQQNAELARMLRALRDSRDQIQRQNRELHLLATCDPLTRCLNRRSFFEGVETHWSDAAGRHRPSSFIMVDIDHFKSINDRFGHSVGDAVLTKVGEALSALSRDGDLACRYGGEEFCLLLPNADADAACQAAERCRAAIEALAFEQVTVTASLGVATSEPEVCNPQELIDRADQALYAAKHGGRNRVVRWEATLAHSEARKPTIRAAADSAHGQSPAPPVAIPFHAVTALTSALAYRDTFVAEHSRQVAELSVATAKGLLSTHECYVLEVAAMLHDIGKMAIPDAILLKPGRLTEDEWKIMRRHDRIGAEILEAAFSSSAVTEIVRTHHAWYGGNPEQPELPTGLDIPLGARILAIADAFQAMIADRVYRKARSYNDAFIELRRCAGTQFDPELVERFIETVESRDQSRGEPEARVSKQAALNIGLQIERLTLALDQRDFATLAKMAGNLTSTAEQDGVPQIAALASQLEQASAQDPDLMNIVQLTTELLDLCRQTQRCYLDVSDVSYQPTYGAKP